MKRPEYVHCAALVVGPTHPDYGKSWCGRPGMYMAKMVPIKDLGSIRHGHIEYTVPGVDFAFVTNQLQSAAMSADGALLHIRSGGRYLLCPECATELRKALDEGTWDGTHDEDEPEDE